MLASLQVPWRPRWSGIFVICSERPIPTWHSHTRSTLDVAEGRLGPRPDVAQFGRQADRTYSQGPVDEIAQLGPSSHGLGRAEQGRRQLEKSRFAPVRDVTRSGAG